MCPTRSQMELNWKSEEWRGSIVHKHTRIKKKKRPPFKHLAFLLSVLDVLCNRILFFSCAFLILTVVRHSIMMLYYYRRMYRTCSRVQSSASTANLISFSQRSWLIMILINRTRRAAAIFRFVLYTSRNIRWTEENCRWLIFFFFHFHATSAWGGFAWPDVVSFETHHVVRCSQSKWTMFPARGSTGQPQRT